MQGTGSHVWTPLNSALWSSSEKIVKILVENGADVELAMKNDIMSLHSGDFLISLYLKIFE